MVGQNGPAANILITAEYTISNFVLSTRNQRSALQCGSFDAGFLRVRRGKALRRAYAVGTHKRFGKVVVFNVPCFRARNGFQMGINSPAGQVVAAAALCTSMRAWAMLLVT